MLTLWNKFFFTEKTTEGIALFRIFWMGLTLLYFIIDLHNIDDFYGPHGIISHATAREQFSFWHLNLFNLFTPSYGFTYTLTAVYGVSLLASTIGLYTRASLIIAFICMTSFHQRNIWLLSSAEVLLRTITLLLIVSPCGHSLSVDSLLGRRFAQFRKKKIWPVWSLRLIQIQVSVVYLWTFWHKLQGESWLDGTAVYYATRLSEMSNFSLYGILDSTWFLKAATWGTLIIEFALGVLIWINKLRKPVIMAGVLFHLGIEFFMSIPFFELYMMVLLLNFFTPEEHKLFILRMTNSCKQVFQESLKGQHETAN